MERRQFIGNTLAGGILLGGEMKNAQMTSQNPSEFFAHGDLVIERPVSGKPYAGKVLAAIQPHSDDIPIFAAGTIIKLLNEGYAGYLIRVTNDDMAGPGSIGETGLAHQHDKPRGSRGIGVQKNIVLNLHKYQTGRIHR